MNRHIGSTYKNESLHRKNNKQIMEKRRRARINRCLSELKVLVLKGLQKEESEFAKLEKADILEMAVTYLKNPPNQHDVPEPSANRDLARYRSGFTECAKYVYECIGGSRDVHNSTKLHLMEHLADVLYSKSDSSSTTRYRNYKVRRVRAVKQEMLPQMSLHPVSADVIGGSLPASTTLSGGRTSAQTADTFQSWLTCVDIQSQNLDDIQVGALMPPLTDIFTTELEALGLQHTGTGTSKSSTAHDQDAVWRPW